MKIVDETGKDRVTFGDLKVGDAFEFGRVVFRKFGSSTAAPISKTHNEVASFEREEIVMPVDYDITVKAPAKKKVLFALLPMFGVFKFDAIVWIKTRDGQAWKLDQPDQLLPCIGPNLMVEPVDATVTIRSVE